MRQTSLYGATFDFRQIFAAHGFKLTRAEHFELVVYRQLERTSQISQGRQQHTLRNLIQVWFGFDFESHLDDIIILLKPMAVRT